MLDFTTGCSLETLHHVIPQSKLSEWFNVQHVLLLLIKMSTEEFYTVDPSNKQ